MSPIQQHKDVKRERQPLCASESVESSMGELNPTSHDCRRSTLPGMLQILLKSVLDFHMKGLVAQMGNKESRAMG